MSQHFVNRVSPLAPNLKLALDGGAFKGPVYDVTHPDFGADATGATDSTAAIQTALAAVKLVSGSLYFPVGTFIWNPDVTLLNLTGGLTMFGERPGRSIIKRKTGATSTDLFFVGDPANTTLHTDIAIANLTFDGNRASTTAAGSGVVFALSKVQRLSVQNVQIRNGPFFGFSAKFVEDARFDKILTQYHNRDGFTFAEGCARIACGVIISRETGDDGMAFNGNANGIVQDVTVASYMSYRSGMNTDALGNQGGAGIKISGGCRKIQIGVANIRESADAGVAMIPASSSSSFPADYPSEIEIGVLRVSLAGQRAASTGKYGVQISAGSKIKIAGTIKDSVSDGVNVISASGTAPSQDISIDCDVYAAGQYGVKIDGTNARMTDVRVRGKMKSCGASGLFTTKVDGLTVDVESLGNNVNGNTGDADSAGWSLSDCTKITEQGGRFESNRYGIRVYGTACDKLRLNNPIVTGNTNGQIGFVTLPTNSVSSDLRGYEVDAVSADRGDVSLTGGSALFVGTDFIRQRADTALTAARTWGLSRAGAVKGSRFRITRTGLGAFTLTVQDETGPATLKVFPAGTAAAGDFEFDGTIWKLSAYGTL